MKKSLKELKDLRYDLRRIPSPGWGWMGPIAPWEKIQKDIKELDRKIEEEEQKLTRQGLPVPGWGVGLKSDFSTEFAHFKTNNKGSI